MAPAKSITGRPTTFWPKSITSVGAIVAAVLLLELTFPLPSLLRNSSVGDSVPVSSPSGLTTLPCVYCERMAFGRTSRLGGARTYRCQELVASLDVCCEPAAHGNNDSSSENPSW